MSHIIPVINIIHTLTELKKMQFPVAPSYTAYCPAITSFNSFEIPLEGEGGNKHFCFRLNLWSVLRYTNQIDKRIVHAHFLIIPLE